MPVDFRRGVVWQRARCQRRRLIDPWWICGGIKIRIAQIVPQPHRLCRRLVSGTSLFELHNLRRSSVTYTVGLPATQEKVLKFQLFTGGWGTRIPSQTLKRHQPLHQPVFSAAVDGLLATWWTTLVDRARNFLGGLSAALRSARHGGRMPSLRGSLLETFCLRHPIGPNVKAGGWSTIDARRRRQLGRHIRVSLTL